ncbi:MAG TPA: HlyD family efflux transporter periplasmic adaptor subunit [Phycisphaerae bacterium]|nr:HlyD family efflux transporter periplasmic adaptor subunit [Phycisphaerae bacterium]HSA30080.1 HlyD family efflux transporter periplasmic adaptor subunit [Phycisphaerae bacterium]
MSSQHIQDLKDCVAIRQTLLARPPKIAHGALLLISGFLGVAVVWSVVTEADLVVRAPGQLRARSKPDRPVGGADEESRVCTIDGGRIIEVHVKEGSAVHAGQVLLRLDTEILENQVARLDRFIESEKRLLEQLTAQKQLLNAEFEAKQLKTTAELARVVEQVDQQRQRRDTEIAAATLALKHARIKLQRLEQLATHQAASDVELEGAGQGVDEAAVQLDSARIPVVESEVDVLRTSLAVQERQHAVALGQLHQEIQIKQGTIDAAKFDMANLLVQMERAILIAPTDGLVTSMRVQVGDMAPPGAALVTVTEQRGFRFDVSVPSDQVGHLVVGMPAHIRLDAYDYQIYGQLTGAVEYISPDTHVTQLPNRPAVASYTVRVALTSNQLAHDGHSVPLKLGMTGQAEIVTDQARLVVLFIRGIKSRFSVA